MSQRLSDTSVLEVHDLRKAFARRGLFGRGERVVPAVDGVTFALEPGRTTVVLGESGCGKSTLARTILHLHRADSGRILLLGRDVQDLSESAFRPYRRHVQMVFQNPLASFDPTRSLGYSIAEPLRLAGAADVDRRVDELLTEVGLSPRFAKLRPRRVSGGELQRAAVARALATRPELVVMDEPTAALDMSIQGQVLRLMRELQERHSISYLIATHDLHAARLVAHDVIVLYLGQIVEAGPVQQVLGEPKHPYTRGLLYAHDLAGRTEEKDRAVRIRGTLKYPEPRYAGCRLVGRCPFEAPRCTEPQELAELEPGHVTRCWRAGEIDHEGGAVAHRVRQR
jgi:oligopeptide/dipeptide ABC transporter ATP-binding protein